MSRPIICVSFVFALLVLSTSSVGQRKADANLDEAIHELDLQQMRVADLVSEAKQIGDPVKKEQARTLYLNAREQYNAFIDDIARHVQFKTKIDPLKHATDAKSASQAFSDYVKNNAAIKAGIMGALLPAVADLIKQFTGIGGSGKASDGSYQERKDLADQVRKYQWPTWDN